MTMNISYRIEEVIKERVSYLKLLSGGSLRQKEDEILLSQSREVKQP